MQSDAEERSHLVVETVTEDSILEVMDYMVDDPEDDNAISSLVDRLVSGLQPVPELPVSW